MRHSGKVRYLRASVTETLQDTQENIYIYALVAAKCSARDIDSHYLHWQIEAASSPDSGHVKAGSLCAADIGAASVRNRY
jgi:hypothetical protein